MAHQNRVGWRNPIGDTRMAFETPRSFTVVKDKSLAETMERLRRVLRVDAESRLNLVPSTASGTEGSAARQCEGLAVDLASESSSDFCNDTYSQVMCRGSSFVARRIDGDSVLRKTHSLAQLRMNLQECRTILRFFDEGPPRTGPLAGLKNGVTTLTRRVLNWFIAPSMNFDRASADALNECAASLDLLARQLQVLARQTADLADRLERLEHSQVGPENSKERPEHSD